MIQLFTPPDSHYSYAVNYFLIMELILIALIAWLGMSIANRAIRDARREAANLRAIYEHVADGILVLDLHGDFLSANPALLKMIPEAGLQEMLAAPLDKTIRWKIFSVSASDVPDVGTVAIIRDETRRHETERARDTLLAIASHELRTPLTAIMNYLEMLQMLIRLDRVNMAEFTEHLARAIENSRRLKRLVDDILDQAQIQAGVLELKPQTFNLRGLLAKVRTLLDSLIQKKQLACELSVDPGVPEEITGDPERLHQVLVNLVSNAIKFTNQGGIKINVSTPQKDQLVIQVADTGPGIPPEQLPDIFEAFRRGSNYAQRERQGAGLGLSIAREIVTRMGGDLSAASQPGSGSTFTITLPIEAAYS
jgi:signal transduction histidine kinase